MHSLVLRLQMLALVHGQAASSAAEAVALGTELAAVADFAVQLALVLGAVCRVEQFAAKTCNTRSSPVVGGLRCASSCSGVGWSVGDRWTSSVRSFIKIEGFYPEGVSSARTTRGERVFRDERGVRRYPSPVFSLHSLSPIILSESSRVSRVEIAGEECR